MPKIHVLDPHEAQKIAAGEVVERPANIVKELLENSVDAGSTAITIHIKKAGKELIKISDDGCGMDTKDALLCFTRHATSKLRSVNELTNINSFGFRGEALASIAAVSKVVLTTKENNKDLDPGFRRDDVGVNLHDAGAKPNPPASHPDSPASHPDSPGQAGAHSLATQITYHDGKLQEQTEVARPTGTTIEVSDLFYSVPVRKAFLKQDETEWNAIQQVVWGIALTHKNISFKLFRDGSLSLNAPATENMRDRLMQVWGHNLVPNMQDVVQIETAAKHGITLSGMISQPSFWRYSRHNMVFFVNGRLVKNSALSKAVMKGYRNVLPPGRFPAVCISIELQGSNVDVNIHPRKEEVRFTKPGVVAREVERMVSATLEAQVSTRLGGAPQSTVVAGSPAVVPGLSGNPASPSVQNPISRPVASRDPVKAVSFPLPTPFTDTLSPAPAPSTPRVTPAMPAITPQPTQELRPTIAEVSAQAPVVEVAQQTPTIIGQIFKTYILIQSGDELIIMDQHAAHERVLYHEFANNFERKEGTALLFPEIITLQEADMKRVLAHTDFFTNQGIGIQQAGPNQISITSTPPRIQKESLSDLVHEMAAMIAQHEHLDPEPFARKLNEHIHSHMSCKAAVKAGDVLDHDQMLSLVKKLLQTPNRFICVHGRPTMWPITQKELEKKFRRI